MDLRQPSPHHLLRARVLKQVIEPGGIGVECGVFKGEFSHFLLQELAPSKLYLMDPWFLLSREWSWANGDKSTVNALCRILHAYEDELLSGRVIVNIGDDLQSLAVFPDNYLDWAYVDSTHSYNQTVKELEILRRKVKPGGIVSGHDWQPDPAHRHHGVCKAVREAVDRDEYMMLLVDEPTIQWALRVPAK